MANILAFLYITKSTSVFLLDFVFFRVNFIFNHNIYGQKGQKMIFFEKKRTKMFVCNKKVVPLQRQTRKQGLIL